MMGRVGKKRIAHPRCVHVSVCTRMPNKRDRVCVCVGKREREREREVGAHQEGEKSEIDREEKRER